MKIMASRNKLIHIIFLTWVTAVASQVIRPDCEEMCGNVSIPYPFGTREDCYLNEYFLITCNHDFTPPKPFLRKGDIEVIDISLLEGELTIHTSVSSDCYNEKGELSGRVDDSISGLPFPLSTTRNKFTAVGCDTYAIMWGRILSTGCVLGCSARGKDTVTNGSCAGIGCCQTSIPHNFNDYKVRVFSFANHTKVWKFNPCGYAFVVEEESFNFTTADLKDLQNRTRVRSVLDWAVGKQTCEQARNNSTTSFACNPRSHCIEAHNGPGYRCNCSTGYYGNPYLPHGCQDIDECEESLHDCEKKEYCHNIEGNYTCSCPKGYHGDGRKEGERCTANQSIGIKVAAGMNLNIDDVLAGVSPGGNPTGAVPVADRARTHPAAQKKAKRPRFTETVPTGVPVTREVGTGSSAGSGLGVRPSRGSAEDWLNAGQSAPLTLSGLTIGSTFFNNPSSSLKALEGLFGNADRDSILQLSSADLAEQLAHSALKSALIGLHSVRAARDAKRAKGSIEIINNKLKEAADQKFAEAREAKAALEEEKIKSKEREDDLLRQIEYLKADLEKIRESEKEAVEKSLSEYKSSSELKALVVSSAVPFLVQGFEAAKGLVAQFYPDIDLSGVTLEEFKARRAAEKIPADLVTPEENDGGADAEQEGAGQNLLDSTTPVSADPSFLPDPQTPTSHDQTIHVDD